MLLLIPVAAAATTIAITDAAASPEWRALARDVGLEVVDGPAQIELRHDGGWFLVVWRGDVPHVVPVRAPVDSGDRADLVVLAASLARSLRAPEVAWTAPVSDPPKPSAVAVPSAVAAPPPARVRPTAVAPPPAVAPPAPPAPPAEPERPSQPITAAAPPADADVDGPALDDLDLDDPDLDDPDDPDPIRREVRPEIAAGRPRSSVGVAVGLGWRVGGAAPGVHLIASAGIATQNLDLRGCVSWSTGQDEPSLAREGLAVTARGAVRAGTAPIAPIFAVEAGAAFHTWSAREGSLSTPLPVLAAGIGLSVDLGEGVRIEPELRADVDLAVIEVTLGDDARTLSPARVGLVIGVRP